MIYKNKKLRGPILPNFKIGFRSRRAISATDYYSRGGPTSRGMGGPDSVDSGIRGCNWKSDEKKTYTGYVFFSLRFFFRQKPKIEIEVVDPQKWYHSIRLDESFQNLI